MSESQQAETADNHTLGASFGAETDAADEPEADLEIESESAPDPDATPEVDAPGAIESDQPTIAPEVERESEPEVGPGATNEDISDESATEEDVESTTTDESPSYSQQYSFNLDAEDDEEALEPSEESVELDLTAFGADVDHRERESEIAQPEASSFGVDDRKTVTRGDGGEQHALFADTNEDQQTLTGESAANQCMFSGDGGSQ